MKTWLPLVALCAACGSPPTEADAGVDAGSTLPPVTFCFGRPKLEFCEDFDELALPGAFDQASNVGGTATIEDGLWTTEPKAVVMRTTADGAKVTLGKTVTGQSTFKTFLQLHVDEKPAGGSVELFSISRPDEHYAVWLNAQSELSVTAHGEQLGTLALPASEWNSVRLDVGHDGGTRFLSFKIGDAIVVDRKPLLDAGSSLPSPTFTIGLGPDAGAGWGVRFDTITFIYN
ncbi:MAG: hypothetical protein ACO1OB_22650 [Archangium sp.]